MSVLDRSALEASPLSDLHAIASELGLDGFRRLRREELIDAILSAHGGADADTSESAPGAVGEAEEAVSDEGSEPPRPSPRRRGGRGHGRARGGEPAEARDELVESQEGPQATVEGVVELLTNGSGFVRVSPPEPSDEDVYISAAQVRRCELVAGDVVAGPVRRPRRSERFPSLVRVETINGAPADEVAEGTRYEDLPTGFPTERLPLAGEDPTLIAIESLAPFGRGSRVALVGSTRSGKTEALRRLTAALGAIEGVDLLVALAGVRPEEAAEWSAGPVAPASAATLGASADAQAQAVDSVVDQGRRIAARGGDAVVVIDSLDGLPAGVARGALAAARNIVDGGSLTVVATATQPLGGETTVIAFDPRLAAARRFPSIDVAGSGTMRPELLVGEAGAEEIARARAQASGS
ncbi:MAG: Rho termination factor N-terminal domain-containing protein [Solirubrobacteraceae bacterium]